MITFDEYNILGNCMNDTWGKSSTRNSDSNFSSVKASFLGKDDESTQLLLTYQCVLSFGHLEEREREMAYASVEGEAALDAVLKKLKDEFKEDAGRTLKSKTRQIDDDWQLLTLGQHSGRRELLYIKKAIIEVE